MKLTQPQQKPCSDRLQIFPVRTWLLSDKSMAAPLWLLGKQAGKINHLLKRYRQRISSKQ